MRIFKVTDAGRRHLEQELASVEKMFAGVHPCTCTGRTVGGFMGWLRQLFSRRRRYNELSESIREHLKKRSLI